MTTGIAVTSLVSQPTIPQEVIEGPQPPIELHWVDIAYGRGDYLDDFAGQLSMDLGRPVLIWNQFESHGIEIGSSFGLEAFLPQNASPETREAAEIALEWVLAAHSWSMMYPVSVYPDARIHFNLWEIEEGIRGPRITLWEYYYFRQSTLWSRIEFYNWSNPFTSPVRLGSAASTHFARIESSENYRQIERLMAGN